MRSREHQPFTEFIIQAADVDRQPSLLSPRSHHQCFWECLEDVSNKLMTKPPPGLGAAVLLLTAQFSVTILPGTMQLVLRGERELGLFCLGFSVILVNPPLLGFP